MFLSLDYGTFLIQLVNFAIFFAILNVVFLRPVGAALKKRREYIEGVQSDYERYAHQVGVLRADADGRRAAARRAAEETIAKTRSAAERDAQAIVDAQTEHAQATIEQARATVALEVNAAKAREPELSRELAKTLLDRALGGTR
jgi:F0F1-type ATP synthase membrane subunit b/b'